MLLLSRLHQQPRLVRSEVKYGLRPNLGTRVKGPSNIQCNRLDSHAHHQVSRKWPRRGSQVRVITRNGSSLTQVFLLQQPNLHQLLSPAENGETQYILKRLLISRFLLQMQVVRKWTRVIYSLCMLQTLLHIRQSLMISHTLLAPNLYSKKQLTWSSSIHRFHWKLTLMVATSSTTSQESSKFRLECQDRSLVETFWLLPLEELLLLLSTLIWPQQRANTSCFKAVPIWLCLVKGRFLLKSP